MALLIALLSGTVGGLISFELVLHLSGEAIKALASGGGAFLSVTLMVKEIEEKLGLL
ncbi:hypothetical protein AB0L75_40405 [Streptomyces sp. NPDC052101]|uniref:hypothetical protein n=1 Tax=Streptomyces sp. NPDC052101 TaxID=3155763 RepID=UPI00342A23CF